MAGPESADQLMPEAGTVRVSDGVVPSVNRFDRMEWAGAFGDLGTPIPFVVAYISLLEMDPYGVLLAFGVAKIVSGLYYKTPFPVQPMKAIGAVATTQAAQTVSITPHAVYGAGLVTSAIWLVLGITGTAKKLTSWGRPFRGDGHHHGAGLQLHARGHQDDVPGMDRGRRGAGRDAALADQSRDTADVPAVDRRSSDGGSPESGVARRTGFDPRRFPTTLVCPGRHDVARAGRGQPVSGAAADPTHAWQRDRCGDRREQRAVPGPAGEREEGRHLDRSDKPAGPAGRRSADVPRRGPAVR